HVFHWHFNVQVEALGFARVNDRNWPILHAFATGFEFFQNFFGSVVAGEFFLLRRGRNASQIMCDFFERTLGGGESNALDRPSNELFEAVEREREMRAALGRNERVDFVDYDGLDGSQGFARVRSQQKIQRFGSGDEDVGRVPREASALAGGRVPGANRGGGLVK